jgi:hypothetical protein
MEIASFQQKTLKPTRLGLLLVASLLYCVGANSHAELVLNSMWLKQMRLTAAAVIVGVYRFSVRLYCPADDAKLVTVACATGREREREKEREREREREIERSSLQFKRPCPRWQQQQWKGSFRVRLKKEKKLNANIPSILFPPFFLFPHPALLFAFLVGLCHAGSIFCMLIPISLTLHCPGTITGPVCDPQRIDTFCIWQP